jgi:hypothetical protein
LDDLARFREERGRALPVISDVSERGHRLQGARVAC